MTSWNVKSPGLNMPLRATSIMPLDVTTPTMIPAEATSRIVRMVAALEPIAELRKLTASLVTPTKRPETARIPRITTITVYISLIGCRIWEQNYTIFSVVAGFSRIVNNNLILCGGGGT